MTLAALRMLILLVVSSLLTLAADVSGEWRGTMKAGGGSWPFSIVLKQKGTKLSGEGGPSAGACQRL